MKKLLATIALVAGVVIGTLTTASAQPAAGEDVVVPRGTTRAPGLYIEGDRTTGLFSDGLGRMLLVSRGQVVATFDRGGNVILGVGGVLSGTTDTVPIFNATGDGLDNSQMTDDGTTIDFTVADLRFQNLGNIIGDTDVEITISQTVGQFIVKDNLDLLTVDSAAARMNFVPTGGSTDGRVFIDGIGGALGGDVVEIDYQGPAAMDGNDILNGLRIDIASPTATGANNFLNAVLVETLAVPQANLTERGLVVENGFDIALDTELFDVIAAEPAAGTPGTIATLLGTFGQADGSGEVNRGFQVDIDNGGSNITGSTFVGINAVVDTGTLEVREIGFDSDVFEYSFRGSGLTVSEGQAVIGTTTGDGTPRAITLTPTSSYVEIDCQDVDSCDVTMSEFLDSNAYLEGTRVEIAIVGATGTTDFTDSGGVLHLSATPFNMDVDDILALRYTGSVWLEVSRSVN